MEEDQKTAAVMYILHNELKFGRDGFSVGRTQGNRDAGI